MDQPKDKSQQKRPFRVSHRYRGFDYAQADAYFVTICSHNKKCLFGAINCGAVILSRMGIIAREEWLYLPERRPRVRLDEFVIMPNHMHGIIILAQGGGTLAGGGTRAGDLTVAPTSDRGRPTGPALNSLGAIVGQFKAGVTRRIRVKMNRLGYRVWQRDYYDHIIRDDDDWDGIRAYIIDNPMNWRSDPECPKRLGKAM